MNLWRHRKRGSEYSLLGFGKMQAEKWYLGKHPLRTVDMCDVAIYICVDDQSLWVRPKEEFEDGRFEELADKFKKGFVIVPVDFLEFVKNAPVSSGVCCCGSPMDDHPEPMSCGHGPVDQWNHSLSSWLEQINYESG